MPIIMNTSPIKLSTSLFSLALEWQSRNYTLEQLLAKLKELHLGPGLEIVGFQSLKNFPFLADDQITDLKKIIEKYEFEPSCLDANVDIGIRRGSKLSIEETVKYLVPQIWAASALGFPVVRIQMMAKPEVMERLVPVAEKANVKLGMELHTPYAINHPGVMELRELYAKIDSPYLGFIPDFGTSMRAIPEALLYSFRSVGVTDELIAVTKEIWAKDVPMPHKFGELQERASALGATPAQIGRLNMAFSMNGRQPVEMWKEIVPQTVHIHGKFYGFDENGDEPSIDYASLLKVFHDGGYQGYISSEYEGTAFTDEFSGFEMVEKHQALCRKILNSL